jgi:hypothetical protein
MVEIGLSFEQAPGVRRIAVLFREQHRYLDDALVALAGFRAHRGLLLPRSPHEVDDSRYLEGGAQGSGRPSGTSSMWSLISYVAPIEHIFALLESTDDQAADSDSEDRKHDQK